MVLDLKNVLHAKAFLTPVKYGNTRKRLAASV